MVERGRAICPATFQVFFSPPVHFCYLLVLTSLLVSYALLLSTMLFVLCSSCCLIMMFMFRAEEILAVAALWLSKFADTTRFLWPSLVCFR